MGLIMCPDCKKEFSDRIDNCPFCGCPKAEAIAETKKSKSKETILEKMVELEMTDIADMTVEEQYETGTESDLKKGSLAVVLICLFLTFVNLLHPYIENELTYDVALFCGWFDMVFNAVLLMPVPILFGVFTTKLSQKSLHRVCLINSIALFGVSLVGIFIAGQPIMGWITVTFFYFINKNIVLLIRNKVDLESKKKMLVSMVCVFCVLVLSGAGCYIALGKHSENIHGMSIVHFGTAVKYRGIKTAVLNNEEGKKIIDVILDNCGTGSFYSTEYEDSGYIDSFFMSRLINEGYAENWIEIFTHNRFDDSFIYHETKIPQVTVIKVRDIEEDDLQQIINLLEQDTLEDYHALVNSPYDSIYESATGISHEAKYSEAYINAYKNVKVGKQGNYIYRIICTDKNLTQTIEELIKQMS